MPSFRPFPKRRRTIRSTIAEHDRRSAPLRLKDQVPDRYWLGLSCVIAGLAMISANEIYRSFCAVNGSRH